MGQFQRLDEFLAPKPGTTFGLPFSLSPDNGLLLLLLWLLLLPLLLLLLLWLSRRHAGGTSSGDSIYAWEEVVRERCKRT